MRHLDLFSGIGGFALAAQKVWAHDHEIVAFCEKEPYCQKVLKKHWPAVVCHDDIKKLGGAQFGTIDLITGGFPCQPFSCAGKQGGKNDDRHLWPEMFRIIQEAKPTWIIGENVAGIINMVEFEQCFIDLESEGYKTQAIVIPACSSNAKHRRDRVWILANSESNRNKRNRGAMGEKKKEPKKQNDGQQFNGKSQERNNVPHAGRVQPQDSDHKYGISPKKDSNGITLPSCSTRGQYFSAEPGVGRVADGVPNRMDRIKGLGNAIVPQVVMPIMEAIKAIDNDMR